MMDMSVASLKNSAVALPSLDRLIGGVLCLVIASLPFKGLLFIERNGFIVLLILLAFWCAMHRRLFFVRTPLDLPLIAFVLWVGLTIPFATYPLYSLKEFGKLLQQGLVFYAVVFFFQAREHWTRLVWLLVGVFVLVGANGLLHFDETLRGGGSFLKAEVWLTTYLILMLPLCFAFLWYDERPQVKGLSVAGATIALGCLLLTQSRAGLVVFLVELWAFAWLLRRRTMVFVAALLTLLIGSTLMLLVQVVPTADGRMMLVPRVPMEIKTSTSSFVHRLDIWAFMLERIAEHPVVGIGYGKETSKMLFGQVPEENLEPGHAPIRKHGTHNILLEMALLVGIPGLLLFVWLAVRIVRMVVSGFRRAEDAFAKATLLGLSISVIGLAVRIQFDQMLVGTLAIQFWVMMAIAVLACGAAGASAATEEPLIRACGRLFRNQRFDRS